MCIVMDIKAIKMFDGGFMHQQFAFGGESKEETQPSELSH